MSSNKRELAQKFAIVLLVGVSCALLALLLKKVTELMEVTIFRSIAKSPYNGFLIFTPLGGLLLIWVLNRFVFKGAASKGLTEVIDAVDAVPKPLNPIKIISHFFGGLLTVSSGGSTGVEVSTVISSGAIGSLFSRISQNAEFKKQLVIAGAAAGICSLFNSPLGGLFFGIEVLAGSMSLELFGVMGLALTASYLVTRAFDSTTLFDVTVTGWHWRAIPYYVGFSLVTALMSVYLTKLVITTKTIFIKNFDGVDRVFSGGVVTGICLFLFLPLYGEGYQTIQELLSGDSQHFITGILENRLSGSFLLLSLALVLLIKPIATSLTLASGGDGGVFAPSLFLGAIAGLLFSHGLNMWISADLIEVNFIIVGMAAILGASIHAPLTAIFITASVTGSYVLVVPLLLTSFLSKVISKKILPYRVYSYEKMK